MQRQLIWLRPIRTTAIGCQRALVAVEASDLARCWRDEVVRQGRMLSRLDGEMCEALAGADGERPWRKTMRSGGRDCMGDLTANLLDLSWIVR